MRGERGGGVAFLFSGGGGMLVWGVALLALVRLEGREVWESVVGRGGRAVAWLRWLPPAERGFSGALSGGRASSLQTGEGPAGGSLSRSVNWSGRGWMRLGRGEGVDDDG